MKEVTVTVDYKGKNYLTNVIAEIDTPEEKIIEIAREQVIRQWMD